LNVLIVGGGGREHALAWKLASSKRLAKVFVAPGNAGTALEPGVTNVDLTDVAALVEFAASAPVAITVVGPEAPLAAGIVDAFRAADLRIFGPTRAAAQLESSKDFAKTFMSRHRIPTAAFQTFTEPAAAHAYIDGRAMPIVVKADGLAAGKGVVVAATREEAHTAIEQMLVARTLGIAGARILVEDFLEGEEASFIVMVDGRDVLPLASSQDHKRLGDADCGPNTGGMGAYSPVSLVDQNPGIIDEIVDRIIRPTLSAMRANGTPFTGLLYVGAMLTADGPKVVEFNCRFGDPETQAVLPAMSLEDSMADAMFTIARGDKLSGDSQFAVSRAAVTTVLAAPGYPEAPRVGAVIAFPPLARDVLVFHAGTKQRADGSLVTAGGRVLAVTGVGATFDEAQSRSQKFAREIEFEGKQFRADIGWRELERRAGATGD